MKYCGIVLTIFIIAATVTTSHMSLMYSYIPDDEFSDSLYAKIDSGSALAMDLFNYLDKYLKAASPVMLFSAEEDNKDEDGGKENDGGDDKKEEDTGPDRIWGAVKRG